MPVSPSPVASPAIHYRHPRESEMASPISSELGRLLALRRVHRGHVILSGDDLYLDHGHRIPGYLHAFLRDLLADGYLCLGEQHEGYDQRPVLMTTSGHDLHHTLENAER